MMKCNDVDLAALLDEDEEHFRSGDNMIEIAQHVESCECCQSRLSELAADDRQWNELQTWLSPGELSANVYAESLGVCERWKRPTALTQSMATSLLSPPRHPEMLGRIGRYDVERLIGSGGMGVVFKAYDTELNRPVAVKLLAPYLSGSGAARNRFAREARAAAAVVDEHVVAIHNVESDSEHPFLVMKYIAGGSLQLRLDREGPLDVCEVLRIGLHTAQGLAAAHAQGLIHRDVKPSNILLDEGVERALLTDFGLARATDDASLTRSGFHPGTPHYMSPEQVRGEAIDPRSDLFGLGCVLYAMCTGHPPFRSETSYAVLRRITDDTPRSTRETNPSIPPWLDQIVMTLLAKSPEDRFESAEQVAELLENCLAHTQNPTTTSLPESIATLAPQQVKRRTWTRFVAAAVFALSLLFAGVLIVLEWSKGTLTIESEAGDVPIRIIQGDEVVRRLTVTKGAETVRIVAGPYVVEIDGKFSGFKVDSETVSLSRGGTETVKIVRSVETPASELGEFAEMRDREQPDFADASPSELNPAAQALAKLQTEFREIEAAYYKAAEKAVDEVEMNRVSEEMNPREIMPAKYLAFEEKHRGTDSGLKALTEVAKMARGVGDPTSNAAKGRVEAADRLIKHYLHHQGLEAIAASFSRGPFFLRSDGFLQALVEKSPYRKTQAEALIAQLIHGNRFLTVESQLPTIIRSQMQSFANEPPQIRTELQDTLKKLDNTDFKQLRADLNDKLKRLADTYSDIEVEFYGTGGAAAQRLSHAINKVIVGAEAPEIAAADINGQAFRLSKLRGNVVVLLFAERFSEDYKEMYAPLRQLVAKYKQAPVRFVGIMSSDDQANLRAASRRGDLNWTVIPQPLNGPLQLDWGIEAYPSVYIVDAEGILQPQLRMPYYGDGGYDARAVDDKLAELLRPSPGYRNSVSDTSDRSPWKKKERIAQGDNSYCLVWESANDVRLRQEFAETLDLDLSARTAVNSLLTEIWNEYVDREQSRTEYSRATDGHLIAEIGDVAKDRNRLANEFWSKLGKIVSDAQRERIFRSFKTRSDRAFGEIWKSESDAYPTLLGWSKDNSPVRVEIREHNDGFHWYVRPGSHGVTGDGERLPFELEHCFTLGNEKFEVVETLSDE